MAANKASSTGDQEMRHGDKPVTMVMLFYQPEVDKLMLSKSKSILVIGAGITGAVLARAAADGGHQVLVADQREHIGGNCYDKPELDSFTHCYGPHLFHTSDKRVVDYLSRFTKFIPYFHKVRAYIDGGLVPIPFSLSSLSFTHPEYLVRRISQKLIAQYGFGSSTTIYALLDSPDRDLCQLGQFIYEKVFKGYSQKQWGIEDPLELDKAVLNRIPVRVSMDCNYFTDTFQFLPENGYSNMISNMLSSPGITLKTSKKVVFSVKSLLLEDGRVIVEDQPYDHVFYTGTLDEFCDYSLGSLPYRSLHFELSEADVNLNDRPSLVSNYPCNFNFTRICDYSHIARSLGKSPRHSRIATEYPGVYDQNSQDFKIPYYPLFTQEARANHAAYKAYLSSLTIPVTVCGRLGHYRYYDMDDAIIAALSLVSKMQILEHLV